MNFYHLRGRDFHFRSLQPTQQGCAALHKNLRGGAPNKENQPTSEITPPHTSSFHFHTRPRSAHSSGASCANPHLNSRATHARKLLPAASASAPFGFVLVRVRVRGRRLKLVEGISSRELRYHWADKTGKPPKASRGFVPSLSQRRHCLSLSSASPRSGCA